MRLKKYATIGGAILLTGLLAACGGSNNTAPTPPAAKSFESMFGAGFAAIFDQSSTSTPVVPTTTSVPALQPTATPIAVPAG